MTATQTPPPTYPGERTALAWRRTAIAAMGTAVLFVNHAATSGWHPAAIAPVMGAVVLVFLAGLSFARNNSLHHGHWHHGPQVIAIATVAVLVVCGIALVIGLTYPGKKPAVSIQSMPEISAVTGGRQ